MFFLCRRCSTRLGNCNGGALQADSIIYDQRGGHGLVAEIGR